MAKTSPSQRRQKKLEKTLEKTTKQLGQLAPKTTKSSAPVTDPVDTRSAQEIYESLQTLGSPQLKEERAKQTAFQEEKDKAEIEVAFQIAEAERLAIQAQKDQAKIKTPEQRAQALVLHGPRNLHSRLYDLEKFQTDLLLADSSASSNPEFTDALAAYYLTEDLNLSEKEKEKAEALANLKEDFPYVVDQQWKAVKEKITEYISKEDRAAVFKALPYETKKEMIALLPDETKNNPHIRALNFHAELLRLLMSTKGKVSGLLGGTSVDGANGRFPRHAAAMLKIIQSGQHKTPEDLINALKLPQEDSKTRYRTKRDPAVKGAYANISTLMTEFTQASAAINQASQAASGVVDTESAPATPATPATQDALAAPAAPTPRKTTLLRPTPQRVSVAHKDSDSTTPKSPSSSDSEGAEINDKRVEVNTERLMAAKRAKGAPDAHTASAFRKHTEVKDLLSRQLEQKAHRPY